MDPSSAPPPGLASENRGPGLRAFNIVMIIIVVAATALRFVSRALGSSGPRQEHRFWWDDWVSLLAVPFLVGQQALTLVTIHYGVGYHIWTLPPENTAMIVRIIFAIYLTYDTALFLTKASALLFLSRLFPNHANALWFNLVRYAAHALNIAWFLGIVFGTFFMCDPVAKNWDVAITYGTCGSTSSLFIGSAVPSVAIDLIILILPLPKIWGLQISKGRKLGISVIFFFGYGVVVVSLGRLITVLTSGAALDTDLTYAGVTVVYWVTAEPPITLLSICLPAMLPLGRHLARHYFSPLASKVSLLRSTFRSGSSGLRSRSGNFSSSMPGTSQDSHYLSRKGSNLQDDQEALVLEHVAVHGKDRPGMPRIPTNQEQYQASIHGGEPGSNPVSHESIRVDRDIKVSRYEI
ncbi:hypothetical protein F5Y05DRAFT_261382 [Hypoxylon sp. FL0543]|nr:hypothetical protein F5Y05DRAFT_261382 [Hypoxylon sp. FL0543]